MINSKVTAFAVLVSGLLLSNVQEAAAQQGQPPGTTATRPAKTPQGQSSMPNESPAATRTQTTGASNQDATVKKMNEDEKQKVDTKGK
jgi:hypothetical protein